MFRNETATRTGLRSITGVNQLNQHTSDFSLVGNKLAKLAECPRLVSAPLGFSNRAIANTLQIFKGDLAMRVFSLRHKSFTDYMISISSKPGFSARQLFKMPFSRFSSFALEFGFKVICFFSNLIYLFSRIKSAITVNGEVHNSQINAKRTDRVVRGLFGSINRNGKIENIVSQDKVALLNNSVNPNLLILPDASGYNLTTLQSENRDFIQSFESNNAIIINHCRAWLELMQFLFVPAVLLCYFANTPYCHLSRQTIMLSQVVVSKVMEFYLRSRMVFKGKVRNVITRLIKPFHRLQESLKLLWCGIQFNHQCLQHTSIIEYNRLYCQERRALASSVA